MSANSELWDFMHSDLYMVRATALFLERANIKTGVAMIDGDGMPRGVPHSDIVALATYLRLMDLPNSDQK